MLNVTLVRVHGAHVFFIGGFTTLFHFTTALIRIFTVLKLHRLLGHIKSLLLNGFNWGWIGPAWTKLESDNAGAAGNIRYFNFILHTKSKLHGACNLFKTKYVHFREGQ